MAEKNDSYLYQYLFMNIKCDYSSRWRPPALSWRESFPCISFPDHLLAVLEVITSFIRTVIDYIIMTKFFDSKNDSIIARMINTSKVSNFFLNQGRICLIVSLQEGGLERQRSEEERNLALFVLALFDVGPDIIIFKESSEKVKTEPLISTEVKEVPQRMLKAIFKKAFLELASQFPDVFVLKSQPSSNCFSAFAVKYAGNIEKILNEASQTITGDHSDELEYLLMLVTQFVQKLTNSDVLSLRNSELGEKLTLVTGNETPASCSSAVSTSSKLTPRQVELTFMTKTAIKHKRKSTDQIEDQPVSNEERVRQEGNQDVPMDDCDGLSHPGSSENQSNASSDADDKEEDLSEEGEEVDDEEEDDDEDVSDEGDDDVCDEEDGEEYYPPQKPCPKSKKIRQIISTDPSGSKESTGNLPMPSTTKISPFTCEWIRRNKNKLNFLLPLKQHHKYLNTLFSMIGEHHHDCMDEPTMCTVMENHAEIFVMTMKERIPITGTYSFSGLVNDLLKTVESGGDHHHVCRLCPNEIFVTQDEALLHLDRKHRLQVRCIIEGCKDPHTYWLTGNQFLEHFANVHLRELYYHGVEKLMLDTRKKAKMEEAKKI